MVCHGGCLRPQVTGVEEQGLISLRHVNCHWRENNGVGKSNYARWQQGGQSGCDRKESEAAKAGTVPLNVRASGNNTPGGFQLHIARPNYFPGVGVVNGI